MEGFCRRMKALIYKEFLQLIRDSSSLLLGIVLPIILLCRDRCQVEISTNFSHLPSNMLLY